MRGRQNKLGNDTHSTGQLYEEISNKIKTEVIVIMGNGITNIVHNLSYDPLHDDLLVIYDNVILEKGLNYTENVNKISIDLIDWSLDNGEKVYFKLYKNVK
jgi:hypothetical protein